MAPALQAKPKPAKPQPSASLRAQRSNLGRRNGSVIAASLGNSLLAMTEFIAPCDEVTIEDSKAGVARPPQAQHGSGHGVIAALIIEPMKMPLSSPTPTTTAFTAVVATTAGNEATAPQPSLGSAQRN